MASIYEIAQEAGVSPSTVARALRGTGYCSQENRERILAIAKKMNYIPSHAARSLKSNRTNKGLFCIPDIYKPIFFRMIAGGADVLEQSIT
jgi:DNA-binding LacI/PurR family transcriptional regulator